MMNHDSEIVRNTQRLVSKLMNENSPANWETPEAYLSRLVGQHRQSIGGEAMKEMEESLLALGVKCDELRRQRDDALDQVQRILSLLDEVEQVRENEANRFQLVSNEWAEKEKDLRGAKDILERQAQEYRQKWLSARVSGATFEDIEASVERHQLEKRLAEAESVIAEMRKRNVKRIEMERQIKEVHTVATHPDNADANDYMRGMATGIELCASILFDREVSYRVGPLKDVIANKSPIFRAAGKPEPAATMGSTIAGDLNNFSHWIKADLARDSDNGELPAPVFVDDLSSEWKPRHDEPADGSIINANSPRLGFATTAELLAELQARAHVGNYANYRTVDSN